MGGGGGGEREQTQTDGQKPVKSFSREKRGEKPSALQQDPAQNKQECESAERERQRKNILQLTDVFSLCNLPGLLCPGQGHSRGSLIARCDGSPRRPPAPGWLCIKRGGMFTRPQGSEPRCCASSITFLSRADSSAIVSHSACRLTPRLTTVATRLSPPLSRLL